MAQVKITLVKSLIGRNKGHIATANSLGLRKIGYIFVLLNNDATEGKIKASSYLIEAEEA